MNCFGFDYRTGASLQVKAEAGVLTSVEELIRPLEDGPLLAPGFIDLQVNGFAGVDFCSPAATLEEIGHALRALFSTGCTRLLPTVITGGQEEMLAAARNLARAARELPHGRAFAGLHMEGPHISPQDGPRGAHPARQVRPPDRAEFDRWQEATDGFVKLITISPEWPEAPDYIRHVTRQGVVAAIGHLDASAAQIAAAVEAGATLSTHLGNGAHALLPRHPNYLWQQMAEDRLAASFIVDGIHLDASFLTVALRAKGLERAILITDAVMPAGCAPGPYMLGEVEVELRADASVRVRGTDRLAGAALRMDDGIGHLQRLAGLSLPDAITMATRNPARVGRIAGRQRGLLPGDRADLVAFRFDREARAIRVEQTWLDGELVFEAD
jgi:N-acetylglucosamine-6-phosphate deacetylase